jgi:hypothetical protein
VTLSSTKAEYAAITKIKIVIISVNYVWKEWELGSDYLSWIATTLLELSTETKIFIRGEKKYIDFR